MTGTAHIQWFGKILISRSLSSIEYQPQEKKAGRGVRVKCCNSETQPSSFGPSDEDSNPPDQPSSLMDISFFVFAVVALTKHAQKTTNCCPSHPSSRCNFTAGWPQFHIEGWIQAAAMLTTGLWDSGLCSITV